MKYYTLQEAAITLKIRVRTVREWIKSGKIKAVKAENGWYWKIPESEIERLSGNADED